MLLSHHRHRSGERRASYSGGAVFDSGSEDFLELSQLRRESATVDLMI